MITFYTNKGKTADEWSMDVRVNGQYDCYSFSNQPSSPQGVNSFNGTYPDVAHEDDYEIDFDDVPDNVKEAMLQRLMPIPY